MRRTASSTATTGSTRTPRRTPGTRCWPSSASTRHARWHSLLALRSHAAGVRPRHSRRGFFRGEGKRGQQVFAFKVFVVREEFFDSHPGTEEFEEHFHGIAEAADGRLAVVDRGIDRDAVQQVCHRPGLRVGRVLGECWACVRRHHSKWKASLTLSKRLWAPRSFCWRSISANSRSSSFWRLVSDCGVTILTVTISSPREELCTTGTPLPLRRKVRPLCVPAGILMNSLPSSVGTSTSEPSAASA